MVGSSTGRLLRLEVNDENLPVMGRNAQGPVLLRLLPGEAVIGAAAVNDSGAVCLATQQGSIKQLPASEIRQCNRGDIGQIGMRFEQRGDQVVDLRHSNSVLLAVIFSDGSNMRIDSKEIGAEEIKLGVNSRKKISIVQLEPLTGDFE